MNCPECNAECDPTAVPNMVATDAKGRAQQQYRCECVGGWASLRLEQKGWPVSDNTTHNRKEQ